MIAAASAVELPASPAAFNLIMNRSLSVSSEAVATQFPISHAMMLYMHDGLRGCTEAGIGSCL